jgi:hypothetical protein
MIIVLQIVGGVLAIVGILGGIGAAALFIKDKELNLKNFGTTILLWILGSLGVGIFFVAKPFVLLFAHQ